MEQLIKDMERAIELATDSTKVSKNLIKWLKQKRSNFKLKFDGFNDAFLKSKFESYENKIFPIIKGLYLINMSKIDELIERYSKELEQIADNKKNPLIFKEEDKKEERDDNNSIDLNFTIEENLEQYKDLNTKQNSKNVEYSIDSMKAVKGDSKLSIEDLYIDVNYENNIKNNNDGGSRIKYKKNSENRHKVDVNNNIRIKSKELNNNANQNKNQQKNAEQHRNNRISLLSPKRNIKKIKQKRFDCDESIKLLLEELEKKYKRIPGERERKLLNNLLKTEIYQLEVMRNNKKLTQDEFNRRKKYILEKMDNIAKKSAKNVRKAELDGNIVKKMLRKH